MFPKAMLSGLRVAVLLEQGTNPLEYHYCRLRLVEAGAEVTVMGSQRLDYQLEDHSTARADAVIEDVCDVPFDGVVIPGGLGPEKLRLNPAIVEMVRDCHDRGKVCAGICHGQQVMISAGFMSGRRATSAWSMLDDLRAVGAKCDPVQRAVRDGNVVTAIFPQDLPAFWRLVMQAFAEIEGRELPPGYPHRLARKRLAIVVDGASDSVQTNYLRYRIEEEGGRAVLVGRKAGETLSLGAAPWEWGEFGVSVTTDAALPNPSVVASCDDEAEASSQAVSAEVLDGLLLPGGLGTWMIRGHPGLHQLIREMMARDKFIGAVGRGAKALLSAGVLEKYTVTCAPEMRDDLGYAGINVEDTPVVADRSLLTARGTEQLPSFVAAMQGIVGAKQPGE